MSNKLIVIYEEVGNRCDEEYTCDQCGAYEYPTDENGETCHVQMYRYNSKIYCVWCINDAVNKIEQI
jgi:hypothetical protein